MFYGWKVVCCTFSVLMIGYGIQFCFGAFLPAIEADLGWDRTSLALPYAVYVFLYGILGLPSGWLTDRFGPSPVIAGGALCLGVGIGLFSQIDSLWMAYPTFGVIAAIGMSAVFVPCNATLVKWFVRKRGLAVSLSASGASMGNFVFPPIAAVLIQSHGWRIAYLELAVVGTILIVIISRFIVRDPETKGLRPDGEQAPSEEVEISPAKEEPSYTLAQARRTSVLWILMAIFSCTWLAVFTPFVHIPAGAKDLGLEPKVGAYLLSTIGFGGLFGRLFTGPLSDRTGRLPSLALVMTLQTIGFGLLAEADTAKALFIGCFVFGLSYGGGTVLFPAIVGDQFGRKSAGTIVGFIFAVAGSLAAFGPPFAGYLYDSLGSYSLAYWICSALNFLALCLIAFVPRGPRTSQ